jgi:hypothetical protein
MSSKPPSTSVAPPPAAGAKRSKALAPYLLLLGVGLALVGLAASARLGRLAPLVAGAGVAMCLLVAAVLVRRRSRGAS